MSIMLHELNADHDMTDCKQSQVAKTRLPQQTQQQQQEAAHCQPVAALG
jgi:hypothetical protein